jgi:WD40 repeat protein
MMTARTDLVAVGMLLTAGLTAPLSAQELKLRETLKGYEANVFSLTYSPDGKTLASGTVTGDIRLWDTATNKERAVLKGHTRVASVQFSPDGKVLASAGNLDGTARLWEVATGRLLHTFNLPDKDTVNGVAFNPDSTTLAACGFKGKLPVWDVVTGKQVDVFAGEGARCLAYSPKGKTLAWGSDPQSVRLRDLATGQEQVLAGTNMVLVNTIAFSPDGKMIAVAGGHRPGAQGRVDNVIRVWDIALGKEVHQLSGHRLNVHQVAFSADGKLLASTGQDSTVRLWDIATGKQLVAHSCEEQAARSVAFSPDGNTLAMTAGKTVTLWTVPKAGKH